MEEENERVSTYFILQVKKVKNFAFLHYDERSSALAAIDAMHMEQVTHF